ncbi:MAG TPA: hypothetical protein VH815_16600 [Acidobacteriota bacterium]
MRFFALLCFLLIPLSVMGISVKEVERLAELNTQEDLILQIISDEGVDHPISSKDVIELREHGFSETLIDALWKHSHQNKDYLPPQEGESMIVGENLRSYQSTDKAGNKITVLTNLDESGRPMNPPPPPPPEHVYEAPPEPAYQYPAEPQVVYVPERRAEPAWATQEEDARMYQDYPYGTGFPTYYGGYYPATYSVFSYPIVNPRFGSHCSTGGWLGNRGGSPLWRSGGTMGGRMGGGRIGRR